jgi:hypothetical protein
MVREASDSDEQVSRERTAQIIRFDGLTKLDVQAHDVLGSALAANLKCAVVLGYDEDGEEYFASSMADGADVLWLLERLKLRLLTVEPPPSEG